jgi:hypothetical protein
MEGTMGQHHKKPTTLLALTLLLAGCQPDDTRGTPHQVHITNTTDLYILAPGQVFLPPHVVQEVHKYPNECFPNTLREYDPANLQKFDIPSRPVTLTTARWCDGDVSVIYSSTAVPSTQPTPGS